MAYNGKGASAEVKSRPSAAVGWEKSTQKSPEFRKQAFPFRFGRGRGFGYETHSRVMDAVSSKTERTADRIPPLYARERSHNVSPEATFSQETVPLVVCLSHKEEEILRF